MKHNHQMILNRQSRLKANVLLEVKSRYIVSFQCQGAIAADHRPEDTWPIRTQQI